MATELGVARNTVGNYLAGRSRPSKSVLRVWALRTGVPFEWLQSGKVGDLGDISPVTIGYPAVWGTVAA